MDYRLPNNLSQVEKDILKIILQIGQTQKHFTFEKILKVCYSKLNYSKEELFLNLKNLYKKNILVEGRQLVRTEIFDNTNRHLIYQEINKNPGIHLRELIRQTGLPSQTCCWHLVILKEFKFIKSIKFKNQICFGKIDVADPEIKAYHLLRNALNTNIVQELIKAQRITLQELSENLKQNVSTIRYHVKDLENVGLIETFQDGNSQFLKIRTEESRNS